MSKRVAALLLTVLASLAVGTASAGVISGSYTGNGSASRAITGLGFRPDIVIVKGDSNSVRAIIRTATMGSSKEMTGSAAATAGYVLSLDPDGFTVSGNARVNQVGTTYYWIAFETVPGESKVGSYTGNGNNNRPITGVGFSPSYAIVIPESGNPLYQRSSLMQESYEFDDSDGHPDRIEGMLADGFQIGNHNDVNRNGDTYHYVAWKAIPGRMAVGSYVGLNNDNRSITGVGFRPVYVIVKSRGRWYANHKPVSTGPATDSTLLFNLTDNQTNNIQALQADGFQVGSHGRVNGGGDTLYWVAWGAPDGGGLVTSRGGSTITVETPAVKMVWDETKGAGLHQFYAKTEANPGTSRVGADASYNLFATALAGLPEAGAAGLLELLEATPTRVRIRQKRDFIPGPNGAHLERDWTVYGTPRLGIDETLSFDTALGVQGLTGLHAKGQTSGSCSVANTFYCWGRSDATNRIWLATDNLTTYSDMLAIPYTSPFFGRGGTSPAWNNLFEVGTPNSWVARVRETGPLAASGTDTRFYLLYPRLEGLTPAGNEWQPYANDYRLPSSLTMAQGSIWVDPAENTLLGEPFNEAEAAYVLDTDPVNGLDFSLDGSATSPRLQPFFKIRQWRSLQEPATVVLQGTALVNGFDFTADVKPVAHAVFCTDPACTTSTRLARGGLVGDTNEYLADGTRNFTLALTSPAMEYLYLGADSKFRGLNVALQTLGSAGVDLKWEYWNGFAWADLEAVSGFTDLTSNLMRNGAIFWTADPAAWAPTTVVTGGPSLYYVRVSLASGTYSQLPVESLIKTDILLFQYLGSITASGRRFVLASVSPSATYRSIGTRANYGTAQPEGAGKTVTATLGSTVVTGSAGTAWLTANRGRGDRIQIEGVDYTVYVVTSEAQLELTVPYAGSTASGKAYSVARKFTTLVAWEDCIDGPGGPGCEGVASASLVADSRSEVGIAYRDTPFAAGLTIDGSTTDANHTITLTADHGNRHYGRAGAAGTVALIDNATTGPAIRVRDDHVTVEWLEIRGGSGTGAHGVEVSNLATVNRVVLDDLLIHNTPGNGIEILSPDTIADVYDNVVYEAGIGIRINTTPSGTSQIRLLDDTVFSCNQSPGGIVSQAASNSAVTLRNNIAHSNPGDFSVPARNAASSHNLGSDGTGAIHSPGGGGFDLAPATAASIFVSIVPGSENLHLLPGSPAVDRGADLSAIFTGDIDAGVRSGTWDVGADEVSAGATDLTVAKDDLQATAVPGGGVSYTITVRNNGPTAVSSLQMIDMTPPALTTPSFSAPSRGAYNSGTGTWDFSLLPLGVSETATIQLLASIDPAASGVLANTATVFAPPGVIDPVPQNDSATDTDTLSPSADLALAHTDGPDPVDLGGLLTYTLTVTNNGPSAATGVVLTDVLPAELEFDSVTPSQGGCAFDGPTRILTCALGDILSGGVTVTLTVRPRGLGTFTVTASVVRNEPDPVPGNDSATATTTVQIPSLAVRFMTVTSTSGQNVIEWLNPSTDYLSTELVFRTDRFPTDPTDGTSLYNLGTAGAKDRFVHAPLTNGQRCFYATFVHRSLAPLLSPGRFVPGRPFDTSGAVKWAFSTGGFSVTPPTVGGAGVIATSNDQAVHAMSRGPAGGEWPAGWLPFQVGGPVQSRSPVVPITVGAANPVVFLGAQDGYVYSLDGVLGGSAALPPWPPASLGMAVQAAPAGIFTAFGGAYDYLLVGTRDAAADNALVALNPATGGLIDAFTNGGGSAGIGIINGTPAVDYASRRVYFTSHAKAGGSATTLWCLQLGPPGPVFTGCGWPTPRALGDIDSSPVIRGSRIYLGSSAGGGTVYSIDAASGDPAFDRTFVHGDGQVKGFVFPDRNSDDVYFATDNRVWLVSDAAGGMAENAVLGGVSLGTGARPSTALFVPGSHYVYVGGSDGKLYEIDVAGVPVVKSVQLGDGLSVVGAPSLDRGYDLVHVGTEAGVFYAVSVPLP